MDDQKINKLKLYGGWIGILQMVVYLLLQRYGVSSDLLGSGLDSLIAVVSPLLGIGGGAALQKVEPEPEKK